MYATTNNHVEISSHGITLFARCVRYVLLATFLERSHEIYVVRNRYPRKYIIRCGYVSASNEYNLYF